MGSGAGRGKELYMAGKTNIRSIRFSDELMEVIEAQVGETFTEKYEGLIRRCVFEEPEIKKRVEEMRKELQEMEETLEKKRREMAEMQRGIQILTSAKWQLDRM